MNMETRVDYRRPHIAVFEPIVLRETSTTRLVFIPSMTNSKVDKRKPLLGEFAYQKKSTKDQWEATQAINLQSLKAGDGVRLQLSTSEIHLLKEWFDRLYGIYDVNGNPPPEGAVVSLSTTPPPAWMHEPDESGSETELAVEVDSKIVDLLNDAKSKGRSSDLAAALSFCLNQERPVELIRQMERLNVSTVQQVNTVSGITRLKSAMTRWNENKECDDESFWQSTLREDSFVLSQLFSFPVVRFGDQCYLGGKAYDQTGGKLIDFLLTTKQTNSVLLVEIKTPATKLIGRRYRDVWKVSEELVGAVAQASNYLDRTLMEYANNSNNARILNRSKFYEAFQPRCIVVAGCTDEFSADLGKTKGFELYRNNLRNIEVITFDELFEKTRMLVELLEGAALPPQSLPKENPPF